MATNVRKVCGFCGEAPDGRTNHGDCARMRTFAEVARGDAEHVAITIGLMIDGSCDASELSDCIDTLKRAIHYLERAQRVGA